INSSEVIFRYNLIPRLMELREDFVSNCNSIRILKEPEHRNNSECSQRELLIHTHRCRDVSINWCCRSDRNCRRGSVSLGVRGCCDVIWQKPRIRCNVDLNRESVLASLFLPPGECDVELRIRVRLRN
ncbi:hypothetical protein PMAYCL1PPCAC_00859, partial [Pristionchus mayeri]